MTIKLTYNQIRALGPCDLDKIPDFGKRKTMNAKQAIEAGVSISDLLWVAGKLDRRDLCVKFALKCAQSTAHLNSDPRVQSALDATQAWLDNPCRETADAADAAAYAADAAADAAYVADAADAAAYAAAYAADAAAYVARAAYAADAAARAARAAYAAADAARAAYAAYAAELEKQKQWFVEIFS